MGRRSASREEWSTRHRITASWPFDQGPLSRTTWPAVHLRGGQSHIDLFFSHSRTTRADMAWRAPCLKPLSSRRFRPTRNGPRRVFLAWEAPTRQEQPAHKPVLAGSPFMRDTSIHLSFHSLAPSTTCHHSGMGGWTGCESEVSWLLLARCCQQAHVCMTLQSRVRVSTLSRCFPHDTRRGAGLCALLEQSTQLP